MYITTENSFAQYVDFFSGDLSALAASTELTMFPWTSRMEFSKNKIFHCKKNEKRKI